jgi:4-hydroxybenzoate polyprenyltransferase
MTRILRLLAQWASFVKFSHTIFALPFALVAMMLAARDASPPGWPGGKVFLLILVAMVGGRTCAMAFNRIVDRRFDALNPRTASRHLPRGEISLTAAWGVCVGGAGMLVGAAWALNPLCFLLSPLALFLVCFYSMTKRFTDFTHVWLGLALAIAPLGAWLAVRGEIAFFPRVDGSLDLSQSLWVPLMLGAAVVFWLVGFDLIYATQDYEFDRRHGLHSLVVRWGPQNALGVAFISHLAMWSLLLVFGALNRFRLAYWVGLILILGLLVLEHTLARRRTLSAINTAFFKLNAAISVVFFSLICVEVLFPWVRVRWLDNPYTASVASGSDLQRDTNVCRTPMWSSTRATTVSTTSAIVAGRV